MVFTLPSSRLKPVTLTGKARGRNKNGAVLKISNGARHRNEG
jgi:hypothetical protein